VLRRASSVALSLARSYKLGQTKPFFYKLVADP
jgi:hypothetical protein